VHAPSPFPTTPFCCLEIPPLISWNPSLTYLEIPSLCRGLNSRPLWSLVGCILTPPPSPPFLFLPPNGSPYSNACPPTTTLRYRLLIIQYNYGVNFFFFVEISRRRTLACTVDLSVMSPDPQGAKLLSGAGSRKSFGSGFRLPAYCSGSRSHTGIGNRTEVNSALGTH
jgi:hypothetical protein